MLEFALIALVVLVGLWSRPRARILRGRRLETPRRRGKGRVSWGKGVVPSEAETSHFLILGTTGSGKTFAMRRMMREVLSENACQALVYDAKGEAPPFLEELGLPWVTFQPFAEDGVAWDIAADIDTHAAARQLARILVPEERAGANSFFTFAARDLLSEVVVTLQRLGNPWGLHDLVFETRSRKRIDSLLHATMSGSELAENYFADERTGGNVLMTLRARLADLEPVAEAWQGKEARSLRSWLHGNFVLVLASDESVRAPLDALNQVLFRRIADLLLQQEDCRARRTWLFLDEVREAGKLDGLSSLLLRGRSKGACCVFGLQDIEGLREVYGVHVANEMLGMCSNKAILRLESPETAAWASKVFGEFESIELRSTREGAWGQRRARSEERVRSEVLMPSEFMGNSGGLTGRNGRFLVGR